MGSVADNKALKRGTVLTGRYEISDLLGEGGFGAAYLAKDLARFESRCVVKRLHSARDASDVALRLFEREARTLSELTNDRVPKLHAYFALRGRYYLVQDFIDGESLRARLSRLSRLDEAAVRDIVLQLLDVLEYLHSRTPPVVHRDIKPANLIIDGAGRVHLIDFGAVRDALSDNSASTETRIGTGGFAPLEQCMGHPVPASDLYALGATALNLVSGVEPRDWFENGELVWKNRMPYSPGFAAFLEGTLAPLSTRLQTPAAARNALLGADYTERSTAIAPQRSPGGTQVDVGRPHAPAAPLATPAPATPLPPPPRRRGPLVWALGALVGAAILVSGAMLWNSKDGGDTPSQTSTSAPTAAAAGTTCAERTLQTFRTDSPFDVRILCPANWTAFHSSEQRATRIMSSTDATQAWASIWVPLSQGETLSQFAERWRDRMQIALGPIQLQSAGPADNGMIRYVVVGERFPGALPGSLQIESSAASGNRYFTWSLVIGATPQSRPDAQEVLTSIEFVAPDATSRAAPPAAK